MTEAFLNLINAHFPLTARDAGEFRALSLNGMDFAVQAYEAEGLGHVGIMEMQGMNGAMTMHSIVVNPFFRDAPLLSCDRVCAFGTESLFLELYNTQLAHTFCEDGLSDVLAAYAELPDEDPGRHWYEHLRMRSCVSKKGQGIGPQLDAMAQDYLRVWLAAAQAAPACDADAKRAQAAVYTDGLIANGGPATDAFLVRFGKETTGRFFREVLFGA